MMKRLLTYGLLLLTILASHFVVSACQDDLPETTEVMMTFTTRAVMGEASTAPDNERMQDLRVIMLRENGTVVDNHMEEDINASSVTFTFTTPIQTGGEDFTFLAVANEGSIQSTSKLSWLSCSPGDKLSEETITQIKAQQIGDGTAFDINDGPIPQTKQWTVTVPQASTHVENQQLDFVASKISVQFLNHTMESQTLSGIRISGIGSAADGYLFAQTNNDFGTQGASSNITFSDVTVSAGEPSDMLSYYTYPVSTISSPTLYATWNDKEYNLPIKISDAFITSLKRNDHLQIVVTLTGEGMMYHIVSWEENPTNIGSPTPEGGYQVDGWGNGNNIIIGGETGEEPEEPGGGDEPVVTGDELVLFEDEDGQRFAHNTRIEICSITEVNKNLYFFDAKNLLCIDLYYHATKSSISVTDAWGGTDIISGVTYSFGEVGHKNIQIVLSDSDVAILKQKGMAICPSLDDGGFTLYKVSIKKVLSN